MLQLFAYLSWRKGGRTRSRCHGFEPRYYIADQHPSGLVGSQWFGWQLLPPESIAYDSSDTFFLCGVTFGNRSSQGDEGEYGAGGATTETARRGLPTIERWPVVLPRRLQIVIRVHYIKDGICVASRSLYVSIHCRVGGS